MENKVIETRHELEWHIINEFLEAIENYGIVYTDETFKKLLEDIQKYVYGKISLNGDGEVVDLYVVVLQEGEAKIRKKPF